MFWTIYHTCTQSVHKYTCILCTFIPISVCVWRLTWLLSKASAVKGLRLLLLFLCSQDSLDLLGCRAGWWQTTISRQAAVKLLAHWWFMLVCNWVLIKSVSGAHVMVCFSGPCHVWALCVIGCYRCCECVSGLREWEDRLRCDCSLRNASQRAVILLLLLFLCDKGHKVFCLSARP